MIVEDDPNARNSMEFILGSIFGQVCSAANGQDGLKVYEKEKPDLVITDMMMPVMSGQEMLKKLREKSSSFAVVVITAYDSELNEDQCSALNIQNILRKPFGLSEFEKVMQDAGNKIEKLKYKS